VFEGKSLLLGLTLSVWQGSAGSSKIKRSLNLFDSGFLNVIYFHYKNIE
jgi:hypothetical protein